MRAGFEPEAIQLTSQMPSRRLGDHSRGAFSSTPARCISSTISARRARRSRRVRVNPGLGSGATNRTNTGGPGSSFGIWHEHLDEVMRLAARHRVTIGRLHTHIGSGTDPEVWKRVTRMTLDIAARLPDVTTVNMGGGFKVARVPGEQSADLTDIGRHVRQELRTSASAPDAAPSGGRARHVSGGERGLGRGDVHRRGRHRAEGYRFAKLDTGMTEVTRPSLYGAQHPINVLVARRSPGGARWCSSDRAASRATS